MPIGQIFQGVTTAPCRDFVAKCILKENPAIVYMPCAGRFGSAQAYINHGGVAEKLVTSDICLFSSMLGYLFDESKNVEELQIKNGSPIQPIGSSEIDIVSAAMLAIKYGQIATSSKYGMNLRKEILLNQEKYLESIKKKISVFTQQMSGCKYDIEDMWDVINAAKNDEKACIFVNVPTYKGGYEKMFANSGISWNEPNISQFNPDLYEEIIKTLSDAKCKAFIYSQKNLDMIPDEWQTVYAQPYSIDRTDYVVSNKMGNNTYAVTPPRKPHKIFPIYSDEDITEDTEIEFVQVDKETALYYRDLFVHKLGTTLAEGYFLMLIDGKVNTTIGISMRDVFTLKSEYVGEVFGISRSSIKYKRLGKLFMMCLTSGDFKRFLEARYSLGIREIKGIKTSSLTTYWEGKTDRSVMKLTYREQLKDGTFNSLQGEDNKQIVREIYEMIEDAEKKLEAYISPELNDELDKLAIKDIVFDVDIKTILVTFLSYELDTFERCAKKLNETYSELYVADIENIKLFTECVKRVNKEYDIRAMNTALTKMAEIVLEHLGEDVEDYERVSVRDLLKSAYIPKESAEVIRRAIEKAENEKTITNKNRWQILEYWAADYLGGN